MDVSLFVFKRVLRTEEPSKNDCSVNFQRKGYLGKGILLTVQILITENRKNVRNQTEQLQEVLFDHRKKNPDLYFQIPFRQQSKH